MVCLSLGGNDASPRDRYGELGQNDNGGDPSNHDSEPRDARYLRFHRRRAQCDQGSANNPAAYGAGKCTSSCTTAPYCGDGVVQAGFGEECDSTPLCSTLCKRADLL